MENKPLASFMCGKRLLAVIPAIFFSIELLYKAEKYNIMRQSIPAALSSLPGLTPVVGKVPGAGALKLSNARRWGRN